MRSLVAIIVGLVLLMGSPALRASGPVGIYGIVERVVFEPNEQAAERVQVWGAFALVDYDASTPAPAAAVRGYLYFKAPTVVSGFVTPAEVTQVRREWADLHAVAGTGQAIGFGSWIYVGRFEDAQRAGQSQIYETAVRTVNGRTTRGGVPTDLRVRPATEAPARPVTYQTDSGIVKLAAAGSHATIVKQLRAALGK